jgi:chorismate-pyruvate lyase
MPSAPAILPPPKLSGPEFLQPLRQLYAQAGLALPEFEPLAGEAVPLPYGQLLVHQRDMTPTLESFHGGEIYIEVLRRERREELYLREVVLRLERNRRPVEFGANRVHLAGFPSEARWLILQEQIPLGRILRDHGLPHQTRPLAFFRVCADAFIAKALGARRGEWLYGRQARIATLAGQPLSEVVEILPPSQGLPPRGV